MICNKTFPLRLKAGITFELLVCLKESFPHFSMREYIVLVNSAAFFTLFAFSALFAIGL